MFRACLNRQINEVESLKAMYCGQDELTLWNHSEYDSLKSTLEGKGSSYGDEFPQIAFQLQLPLSPPFPETVDLIIQVTLPTFYPSSDSALVHLSFDPLTPLQEKALREAASSFVESKLGQECVLDLVQFAKDWIYDNAAPTPKPTPTPTSTPTPSPSITLTLPSPPVTLTLPSPPITLTLPAPPAPAPVATLAPEAPKAVPANLGKAPPQPKKAAKKAPAPPVAKTAAKPNDAKAKPKAALPDPKEQDFRRILIWFSTIAPDRSKTIAEWAKQLGLTGISRLGSPALIVVEGQKEDVDEYVSSLRSYRWKKMEIVWEEKSRSTNLNACRRFPNFQECMVALPELQIIFKKAGLEDMYKEGLKIRG